MSQSSHRPQGPLPGALKRAFTLTREKGREKHSQFLLEGVKVIEEVLRISPLILRHLHLKEGFKNETFLDLIKQQGVHFSFWPARQLDRLSDVESPQGVIALADFPNHKIDWNKAQLLTLLDEVQDPSNVGAIFRTSLAMGMDGILLGKGTCDPYNPKVVRSSVGAMLRMPFDAGVDLTARLAFLRQKGFTLIGTSSHAPKSLNQINATGKTALLLGNEGRGSSDAMLSSMDAVVRLPLLNQVESLNVAVAHGLLCYQLLARRGQT